MIARHPTKILAKHEGSCKFTGAFVLAYNHKAITSSIFNFDAYDMRRRSLIPPRVTIILKFFAHDA